MTITWSPENGGTVGGDPDAAAMVRWLALDNEGQLLRKAPASATTHDHLSSPYTALLLMGLCFDRDAPRPMLTGSLPMLPEPPEGAVR